MLVLKLIEKNFYGYDHPEGVIDKVTYHKIPEELTVKELGAVSYTHLTLPTKLEV